MSPVPARRRVGVLPILIAVITGLFFLALVANVVDRLDLFGPKEIRHSLGEQVVIGGVAFTLSDPQWLEPSADMLTYYRENNYYAGEEGDPLFLTLAVEAAVQDRDTAVRFAPSNADLTFRSLDGYERYSMEEYDDSLLTLWEEQTGAELIPFPSSWWDEDSPSQSGRLLFVLDPDCDLRAGADLTLAEYDSSLWKSYYRAAEHRFSFSLPERTAAV